MLHCFTDCYASYRTEFMPILQVISKVGDLVGIKYFPVEQEKTTAVEKLKKIQ